MKKLPFVILSQSVSHTFWSCLGAKIQLFPDREKEERDSSTSGWSTTGYKEMLDDEEWKENEGDSSLFSSHPSEKSSYSWSKCLPHSLTSSAWTWDFLLSLSFWEKKRKGMRGKEWEEGRKNQTQPKTASSSSSSQHPHPMTLFSLSLFKGKGNSFILVTFHFKLTWLEFPNWIWTFFGEESLTHSPSFLVTSSS